MATRNGQYRRSEAESALENNHHVRCYACDHASPARSMTWYIWRGTSTLYRPLHAACAHRYRRTAYVPRRMWRAATERDPQFVPHWER